MISGVYTRVEGKSCIWLQGPEQGWLLDPDAVVLSTVQDKLMETGYDLSIWFSSGESDSHFAHDIAQNKRSGVAVYQGKEIIDVQSQGEVCPTGYSFVSMTRDQAEGVSDQSSDVYYLCTYRQHHGYSIAYWVPDDEKKYEDIHDDIHENKKRGATHASMDDPSLDLLVLVVSDDMPSSEDPRIQAVADAQPGQVLVLGTGQEHGIAWCRYLMLAGVRSPKYLRKGQSIVHETHTG